MCVGPRTITYDRENPAGSGRLRSNLSTVPVFRIFFYIILSLFFFTCVVLRIVLYLQSYRWQERNDKKENYYSIIIVTLEVRGDILLRVIYAINTRIEFLND